MTPKIITIAMGKGGVGKSTTAAHLAMSYAEQGNRTLLVDLDFQDAAGKLVRPQGDPAHQGVTNVLMFQRPLDQEIQPTRHMLLDLLSNNEMGRSLGGMLGAQATLRLGMALEEAGAYEYIIIDTPPSDPALIEAALTVADAAILPVQVDELAIAALRTFVATVNTITDRKGHMPWWILPTMHDNVTTASRTGLAELQTAGDQCLAPISNRADIRSAATLHQTTLESHPRSQVAQQYRDLAAWVAEALTTKETAYHGN